MLISFFTLLLCDLHGQGFVWTKQIGTSNTVAGDRIAVDLSGNVSVSGGFKGTGRIGGSTIISAGGNDIFLGKYDSIGNFLWVRRAGGSGNDIGYDVTTDSNGNVYVVGSFQGVATFGTSNLTAIGSMAIGTVNNIFVAKFNATGDLTWVTRAGGPGGGAGFGIAVDNSGNVYTTGHHRNYSGEYSVFISKQNANGQLLWQQVVPGLPHYSFLNQGNGIKVDSGGNVYVAGCFSTQSTFGTNTLATPSNFGTAIFIAKLNSSGSFIWAKQPENLGLSQDTAASLALDGVGNPVIAGSFFKRTRFGSTELVPQHPDYAAGFVAKCDSEGNFLWAQQLPGSLTTAYGVAADLLGNTFVVGNSGSPPFLGKYDATGTLHWALQPSSTLSALSYGAATDASNRVYLTTWSSGTITFDGKSFTNFGGGDIFLSQVAEQIPPVFTVQPKSVPFGFSLGATNTFTGATRSLYQASYQWRFNELEIPGATNTSLKISNVQLADQGNYSLVATNIYGASTSVLANLTIYFKLAVLLAGSGSVSISPSQTNLFPAGQLVGLIATPLSGFGFTTWSGDLIDTTNSISLNLASNMVITASFSDSLTNIIIDNGELGATVAGTWGTFTNQPNPPGRYGADFRFVTSGFSETATAIYRPTIVVPGFYDVFIWYPQPPGFNYSTKAPWSVTGQSQTVLTLVDQRVNGGGWVRIASSIYFAAGTNGFVRVSNNAGESSRTIVADAVRFLGGRPPAPKFTGYAVTGGQVQLSLNTFTGLTYSVEVSTNLLNWQEFASFTSTNSIMPILDPHFSNHPKRFFRATIP